MVVTPSLAVASLLGTRNVRVIIAGGLVRQDELTCIGASAVEAVRRYNTDTAVIGAAGISARRGVTELDDRDADVIRGGLERTERIIVIADGSKFGAVAMSTVTPIERVATIVTDIVRRRRRDRTDRAGRVSTSWSARPEAAPPAPRENGRTRLTEFAGRRDACYVDLFGVDKPIIAMLHLPGDARPPAPRSRSAGCAASWTPSGATSRLLQARGRRRVPLLQRSGPAVPDAAWARRSRRAWRR